MSGNELMNEVKEGVNETVSEMTLSDNHTLRNVAVAGIVLAGGVAVVMYIRKKRKNAKNNETQEIVQEKSTKSKNQK